MRLPLVNVTLSVNSPSQYVVRADNEKREGKLLNKVINSKGLKVSVVSSDVTEQLKDIMQDQNGDLPETAEAGYSIPTYIMIGVGALAAVAIGVAALVISAKEALQKLVAGQNRSNLLARRAARNSKVDLEVEADSAVVVHCEGNDDKNRVKMFVL
jgi:hypothetical protein